MGDGAVEVLVMRECPLYRYAHLNPPICGAGSDVSGDYVCTEEAMRNCEHITCHDCTNLETCVFAFDPFNTNGDCLAAV